jgi:hypothetical protein
MKNDPETFGVIKSKTGFGMNSVLRQKVNRILDTFIIIPGCIKIH